MNRDQPPRYTLNTERFATDVRRICQQHMGTTVSQMLKQVDVGDSTFSRFQRGERLMNTAGFLAICKEVHLDPLAYLVDNWSRT